jgi:hypothetical protein
MSRKYTIWEFSEEMKVFFPYAEAETGIASV